jgi:hypothetical protein
MTIITPFPALAHAVSSPTPQEYVAWRDARCHEMDSRRRVNLQSKWKRSAQSEAIETKTNQIAFRILATLVLNWGEIDDPVQS